MAKVYRPSQRWFVKMITLISGEIHNMPAKQRSGRNQKKRGTCEFIISPDKNEGPYSVSMSSI